MIDQRRSEMNDFFSMHDVVPVRDQSRDPFFPAWREDVWALYRGHHARALHPRLIGAGAILLIATAATDLAYTTSLLVQWENFSMWLLTGGLVLAAFAGAALVIDLLLHRVRNIDWLRFGGFTLAALLSLLNALVHSRDAYTAVVPQGIELSALVAVLLIMLGWRGWSLTARSHPSKS
jgi:uncharacterized membrane protein